MKSKSTPGVSERRSFSPHRVTRNPWCRNFPLLFFNMKFILLLTIFVLLEYFPEPTHGLGSGLGDFIGGGGGDSKKSKGGDKKVDKKKDKGGDKKKKDKGDDKEDDKGGSGAGEKELLAAFECKEDGKYAHPGDSTKNCNKYFKCAGVNPTEVGECEGSKLFHRISRDCQDKAIVTCDLCRKEGLLEDLSSNVHFIKCAKGNVALRYKCKEGQYDPKESRCDELKKDVTFNPDEHAWQDKPANIAEFEEKWRANKGKK